MEAGIGVKGWGQVMQGLQCQTLKKPRDSLSLEPLEGEQPCWHLTLAR